MNDHTYSISRRKFIQSAVTAAKPNYGTPALELVE